MSWPEDESRIDDIGRNGNTGEHYEVLEQQRLKRIYQKQLLRNPNCRDPEHPGCEHCWDNHDD